MRLWIPNSELEALQKKTFHRKDIAVEKLGTTLPTLNRIYSGESEYTVGHFIVLQKELKISMTKLFELHERRNHESQYDSKRDYLRGI